MTPKIDSKFIRFPIYKRLMDVFKDRCEKIKPGEPGWQGTYTPQEQYGFMISTLDIEVKEES